MIGDVKQSDAQVSDYQPSQEVATLTSYVRDDYSRGIEILNDGWTELGGLSVIDRTNRDQMTFNAFVDESIEDPAEAWKWRGTRSKARNKAIAMHAQLTAGYIIPMFMAQNEFDEEDQDFSDGMRDSVEWLVDNSNYKSSFLMVSMGMLVNPVTYMGAEWAEVFQTIKEKTNQGFTKQEIIDEELSGFRAPVYSPDQILINNAYGQNIQRQRCIIKRRWIEKSEAEAKYGHHENFQYVKSGRKTLYSDDDGLFYDVKDDDHPHLVEEAIYLNRRDDTEVPFIGGIYMGDDDVEHNAINHRNNRNAPRYNVVPFGYQRVNEHFFYYKSLMNAQYWDNRLLDAQYEMGMNRAFLDTNMPVAISGTEKIDSEVIFPSAVVSFEDKDTKVQPLMPQANLGNIFSAMGEVERSMDEASVSPTSSGQLPEAQQKATSVVIAQRNAEVMLEGVGKTLAESIVQYGNLMADIVVNNLAIAQVDEILGENVRLKYRTLLLKDKTVDGKNVDKEVRFDESLLGREMSEKEKQDRELKMLEDIDFPDHKKHLLLLNPELFSRMKYLTRVEPERMFPRNEEYRQALYSQLYAQLRKDPLISAEALVRRLLHAFFRGDAEELINKDVDPSMILGETPQTQFGQQGEQKALANVV